jgi:hypothetical protein
MDRYHSSIERYEYYKNISTHSRCILGSGISAQVHGIPNPIGMREVGQLKRASIKLNPRYDVVEKHLNRYLLLDDKEIEVIELIGGGSNSAAFLIKKGDSKYILKTANKTLDDSHHEFHDQRKLEDWEHFYQYLKEQFGDNIATMHYNGFIDQYAFKIVPDDTAVYYEVYSVYQLLSVLELEADKIKLIQDLFKFLKKVHAKSRVLNDLKFENSGCIIKSDGTIVFVLIDVDKYCCPQYVEVRDTVFQSAMVPMVLCPGTKQKQTICFFEEYDFTFLETHDGFIKNAIYLRTSV